MAGTSPAILRFSVERTTYGCRRTPRQSAAIAAFSVALGLIAADVLAESGR